jgi:hypothetical protein
MKDLGRLVYQIPFVTIFSDVSLIMCDLIAPLSTIWRSTWQGQFSISLKSSHGSQISIAYSRLSALWGMFLFVKNCWKVGRTSSLIGGWYAQLESLMQPPGIHESPREKYCTPTSCCEEIPVHHTRISSVLLGRFVRDHLVALYKITVWDSQVGKHRWVHRLSVTH